MASTAPTMANAHSERSLHAARASATGACAALLRRDFVLAWRRRGELFLPLLYAVIVTALFPFALGPDPQLLARIAGGVLLVIVVLAMLPALESMFRADLEDGTLEQWLLAPQPLALTICPRSEIRPSERSIAALARSRRACPCKIRGVGRRWRCRR